MSCPFQRPFLFTLAGVLLAAAQPGIAEDSKYFAIHVTDEATGRGVPLVQLETTDKMRHFTDSNGYVAFDEPGLMNENVWFGISSYGYEYPHEGFGFRGVALQTTPGGRAEIKLRRTQIAERLYRITGRGIYRDTLLLGLKPPIARPALNGRVIGQDTVQQALYRGKLYWFWGDTDRPGFPLGNFFTSGATSELPGQGGLDPAVGIDLTYFTDPQSGFVRGMVPRRSQESTPIWIEGLFTARDDAGRERLVGRADRVDRSMKPVERYLIVFNDEEGRFERLAPLPLEARLAPCGHSLHVAVDGQEYIYFTAPYPTVRVRNRWADIINPAAYESFSCLRESAPFDRSNPPLDRDAAGRLLWKWRKVARPLDTKELESLVKSKKAKAEEIPLRLEDVESGRPVRLQHSSVYWNAWRKTWVMIGVQGFGDSMLGELWFAEAKSPEGPWTVARKIVTHARKNDCQDFYNPTQHPQFDQQGGRLIYFEGTYVNTFSGNPYATPLYNYNQIMCRLDLSDARLKLREPPPGLSAARPSKFGP